MLNYFFFAFVFIFVLANKNQQQGTGMLKAGFAGATEPSVMFPTL
jgi:hypothetical protein